MTPIQLSPPQPAIELVFYVRNQEPHGLSKNIQPFQQKLPIR
jgi:hypothetical protein